MPGGLSLDRAAGAEDPTGRKFIGELMYAANDVYRR